MAGVARAATAGMVQPGRPHRWLVTTVQEMFAACCCTSVSCMAWCCMHVSYSPYAPWLPTPTRATLSRLAGYVQSRHCCRLRNTLQATAMQHAAALSVLTLTTVPRATRIWVWYVCWTCPVLYYCILLLELPGT